MSKLTMENTLSPKELLIQAGEKFLTDVEPLSKYMEALREKYLNDVQMLRKPYEKAFEAYLDSELQIEGKSIQVGMELKRASNRFLVMDRNVPFKDNVMIYEPYVIVKRVLNGKLVGNFITLLPVAKSSQNTLGEYSIYAIPAEPKIDMEVINSIVVDNGEKNSVPVPTDENGNALDPQPVANNGTDIDVPMTPISGDAEDSGPVGEEFGHCGMDAHEEQELTNLSEEGKGM